MSKIAEQKALEAYPVNEFFNNESGMLEDSHRELRIGYEEGYDQAMQDFLENAKYFFKSELYVSVSDQICSMNEFKTKKDFVNYFKNYIENESEEQ